MCNIVSVFRNLYIVFPHQLQMFIGIIFCCQGKYIFVDMKFYNIGLCFHHLQNVPATSGVNSHAIHSYFYEHPPQHLHLSRCPLLHKSLLTPLLTVRVVILTVRVVIAQDAPSGEGHITLQMWVDLLVCLLVYWSIGLSVSQLVQLSEDHTLPCVICSEEWENPYEKVLKIYMQVN